MRFGPIPIGEAEGAILAHSLRLGRKMLKKGQRLGSADLQALREGGSETVVVAQLGPGDVGEDEAALRIARALAGAGTIIGPAETGRVNLVAAQPGLVDLDPGAVDALNAVAEEITLATLTPFAPVQAGRMVATVKIIPFAVPEPVLARCLDPAAAARVTVRPFRPLSARLVQTVHDGVKPSVLDKTERVTAERLARLGGALRGGTRSAHEPAQLARAMKTALAAGPDLLLVIGASAIVDRRDVIPAAIERLGGRVERLGMPVDPGNLILTGSIGAVPVLGLPGCARSPVRNGLDWVLERLAAGVPFDSAEIGRMGVGGLLIGAEEDKDYR